jgi:hypothetical protein
MEDKTKLPQKPAVNSNKKIEALLAENLEMNKQVLESVNATRKYIKFIRIINVLKVLLIFIPLVFALIYVPPFLQRVLGVYDELLGASPFEILQDFKNGE